MDGSLILSTELGWFFLRPPGDSLFAVPWWSHWTAVGKLAIKHYLHLFAMALMGHPAHGRQTSTSLEVLMAGHDFRTSGVVGKCAINTINYSRNVNQIAMRPWDGSATLKDVSIPMRHNWRILTATDARMLPAMSSDPWSGIHLGPGIQPVYLLY